MSAAILPAMHATGHGGLMLSDHQAAMGNFSEQIAAELALMDQPHRTIPAPSPAPTTTTTTNTNTPLPTLHITTSAVSQQPGNSFAPSSSQQPRQSRHLAPVRPGSIIQQQSRRASQYDSLTNTAAYNRLSLHPSHHSARPLSQVSQTPSFVSARASVVSTASFAESLVGSPQNMASGYAHHNMYPSHGPPMNNLSRRTPSNASNTSSQHESIRRSSSSRSANVSSYVALLRKQKATVWCDRSQAEDPRIMAAQRLAKERAERAVSALPSQSSQAHHLHGSTASNGSVGPGGAKRTPPNSTAGSFTTGVARKIRHHGAQKATTYAGGNMAGAGVPMRLSATEIDDDEDDEGAGERLGSLRNPLDDADWDAQFYGAGPIRGLHTRSASSQSRTRQPGSGSGAAGGGSTKLDSTLATPPNISSPDDDMTPGNSRLEGKDYFGNKNPSISVTSERAAAPAAGPDGRSKDDELRRRGSVDERAMTLSAGRLFVANPDMDSD